MTRFGIAADRHEHPPLGRVFGEQPAVAGVDARHDRRLVMRQLLVIRQVTPKIPDRQPGEDAAGDRHKHDADEQESNQLDHYAQRRDPLRCGAAAGMPARAPRGALMQQRHGYSKAVLGDPAG